MGISGAITGTVGDFVNNFQLAFRPQIIKSYATKDYDYLQSLMIRASKVSSFLVILFFVPIYFEIENVLTLWLGDNYPELAPAFCRWTLVDIYLGGIVAPLWMVMLAQTNICNYQLITSAIFSLNFFGGWLLFWFGAPAYSIIMVRSIVDVILMFVRLYYAKTVFVQFSQRMWFVQVFCNGIIIIFASGFLTYFVSKYLQASIFAHVSIVTLFSLLVSGILILYLGLSRAERVTLRTYAENKIHLRK